MQSRGPRLALAGLIALAAVGGASHLWSQVGAWQRPAEARRVDFRSAVDGSGQWYVERPPDGYRTGELLNLLICLHGASGDARECFEHPAPACRATRYVAARYRLLMVGPDYRGPVSWMGPGADDDVVQVLREVKARYRVDKVIVAGGSMGGTAAFTFTALHPELVDGVVSLCGFADLAVHSRHSPAIARSFGGTPEQRPGEYRRRSAIFWPDRFTMPVAIWTGGKDDSVPPESAIRLAEVLAAKNPGRVKHIHRPDVGHKPSYEDSVAAYEFVLDMVLGPPKK